MSAAIDPERKNNICEWITVTAPVQIHDIESIASRSWVAVLRALIETSKQEGFRGCDWSRVLEQPSHIYIWISWVDKSAYYAQVGEKTHRLLYETLELLSISKVNTKVVQYDQVESYAIRRLRKGWPSITLLEFPGPLSEEERDRVKENLDMIRCVGDYIRYIDTVPMRGLLLHDTKKRESQGIPQHETWIILDYWWNPIREEEIKSVGTDGNPRILCRGNLDRAQAPPPKFVSQLSALGCTTIETRHMRFLGLTPPPDFVPYRDVDVQPRSLDFDWEEGRKSWESENKVYSMSNVMRGYCRPRIPYERDVDAERENDRYELRANGQLKRKRKDYKGMC